MRWRTIALLPLLLLALTESVRAKGPLPEGLGVVFGDMRPGSGLGGGLAYRNDHFRNGVLDLRLESRVSIRLYQQHEAEVVVPHFLHQNLFLEALGLYRSHTQVDYFGVGPDSPRDRHSNYGLNGFAFFGTVGLRPARKLAVGARWGALQNRLRSGRDGSLPSVEEEFDRSALPGYDDEPDYWLYGWFAALDRRDDPEDPTSGAYYLVQGTDYRDRELDRYDFREVEVDVRHFLPVRSRWTIAHRVKGVFTWTPEGHEVPFFLLPAIGGAESLHGFENDRFRDRNVLFINHELRYQASPEIRLEAFVDVGQVFSDVDAIRWEAFELSTGLGARYKLGRNVVFGASLGFGREGARASFRGDFRF